MVFLLILMRNINSLKNTSQFREVYEKGRSYANSLLVVYILAEDRGSSEDQIPDQRLGISVSRKVGNSVVRHRITRIIRESFRSLKPGLPRNCRIVVVARPKAKDKNFSDICDAMSYLCKKLNSFTDPQTRS